MPRLLVTTRRGVERAVEAAAGGSLMQAIRQAVFDELTAICGGSCAYATCHVHVD